MKEAPKIIEFQTQEFCKVKDGHYLPIIRLDHKIENDWTELCTIGMLANQEAAAHFDELTAVTVDRISDPYTDKDLADYEISCDGCPLNPDGFNKTVQKQIQH